eukprot:gene11381-13937_t
MNELIKSLQSEFKTRGFDIVSPFRVGDYNKAAKHKVYDFGIENSLGIIIGCTKSFWEHFIRYIREINTIPKDPMNSFCQHTIEEVISNNALAQKYQYEIRYDWNSPVGGKYVHIQTCGHFAGIAHYDQDVMWSVHPEYGLWFVFRSAVIFKLEYEGEPPQLVSPTLLSPETKATMKHWTNIAIDEGWSNLETRLKIRDSCPIGKEKYRYQGDMFDYFYPIHRTSKSVLESILHQSDQDCSTAI